MRVTKPVWVTHDGKPIFSIHVHPSGKRFATGGQGKDSGRIVIWNMLPIENEKAELDKNVPKIICQMDNHISCVNIVRWSSNGKWLASGGDDKFVMIWMLTSEGPSTIFGSGSVEKVNQESWKCLVTLTAHLGDVLDLAWSPNDKYLATCSVDNSIIIWNTNNKFSERVAIINGHTGLVKGLSWDPIGKYLASQSDDRSVRIWSTADWSQQAKITRPFEECSGTTHVLRLSWSPDGQYIVSAHAINGGGPAAQIIDRDGWKHDKDFVGHRKAVTCVSFNPNIFKKTTNKLKSQQFCCCAIGSRDRSLSFWLSSLKRPLVILQDVFANSVLDLSWSVSGNRLFACSWDGTVIYVQFENNEIGIPMSLDDKNALYEKMYGKAAFEDSLLNTCSNRVIESAEVLKIIENERSKSEKILKNNQMSIELKLEPKSEQPNSLIEPEKLEIEEIKENVLVKDTEIVIPNIIQTTTITTTTTTNSIVAVNGYCTNSNSLSGDSGTYSVKNKQIEIRLPNGKRRITPLCLSSENRSYNDKFRYSSPAKNRIQIIKQSHETQNQLPLQNFASQSQFQQELSTPKQRNNSFSNNLQQPITITPQINRIPVQPNVKPKYNQPIIGVQLTDFMCKDVPEDEVVQQNVQVPQTVNQSTNPLAKITKLYKIIVYNDSEKLPTTLMQGSISKVEIVEKNTEKLLWDTYFGSSISLLNANQNYLLVACKDQNLHAFSLKTSARLFPPIFLEDQVAFLVLSEIDTNICLVITTTGLMHMWNLKTSESLLNRMSLRMFVSKSINISGCQLTSTGCPVIFLTDGKVFMFNMKMKNWQILANPRDPIYRIGYNQILIKSPSNNLSFSNSSSSLVHLQQPTRLKTGSSSHLEKLPSGVVRSFLESQLISCSLLRSPDEFKYWLFALVKHLLDKGPEYRLRSILDDLLGPSVLQFNINEEDFSILGYRKKDLLKELLPIIGSHLPWQRLYNEYNEQLKLLIT